MHNIDLFIFLFKIKESKSDLCKIKYNKRYDKRNKKREEKRNLYFYQVFFSKNINSEMTSKKTLKNLFICALWTDDRKS